MDKAADSLDEKNASEVPGTGPKTPVHAPPIYSVLIKIEKESTSYKLPLASP
jgi:hypothetical protein